MPGPASTRMRTVEVLGAQAPFATDHLRMLVPVPNPVMPEPGNVLFVKTPLPDRSDQVPTPKVGVFALSVVLGELLQIV